ncbi:WcaF family extracellular polysaccharide biosynthesis acetyltransferase [Mucilaginibacter jinjuensis]|uniref:WcaF family extracellular polysaccharide biosynthesis acetyltransferase n=1 Tax=Mucilaginibacter jinjuensis TaxID=1176721 RepID=A0ABY7TCP3_9SPHI|nr:WcaF family extracellular polysaccharide biosynthesis acetyltransferase [Mucilaginibacter jinjuensis]WCT13840.1 WcaF family extracellular polysaccharide biosynthesis acetyltransferase [Mucilaginibacter jinjuensis]
MSSIELTSRVQLGNFTGKGFNRGASKAKETVWYLLKMLFFLSAFPYPSSFKVKLLRLFGAKVGKGLVIKPRVNIHFPWKLNIGNDVWIGEEAMLLNFELLTIGNDVCVSQRAFLCGGNHNYKDPTMPYRNGTITLKDGSWVGASCFIAPGVTIGVDTVVSAGSVITSDLNSNSIYKGNPAVFIKERWA